MLGKLFNLGASSGGDALPSAQASAHKPYSLESVQEDIHTRNLLFPDPQDLYEHRPNQLYPLSSGASTPTSSLSNSFDYDADIELDVKHVRIIIMQDALSSVAASLLYDSQSPPPIPTASMDRPSATAGAYSVQEPRRTPASPRKPSISHAQRPIVIQPGSPKARQGAFDRRPSVHSRNQGHVESESQRAWREYREELATFSSCIFGNSELMAYKGTSTKVHVVPSDIRQTENTAAFGDGRGSIGRSSMRSSRLSQSFSSEHPPPFTTPPTPAPANRVQDRKKVLITRLFPVTLPLDEDVASLRGTFSEDSGGYPFPHSANDTKMKKKNFQPRQKRTPMYAVALVISLPSSPAHSAPATTSRSTFRGPGSYAEQDSFPSSFSSTRRSGWSLVGQGGFGPDSFETSFGTDIEDQIDVITQHWDIIMRTLSHLQSVVANTLFTMLRQADLASPDPLPSLSTQLARGPSVSGRRSEDGPPVKTVPKTNAKHITLLPNCLLDNRYIGAEVDAARTRIVAGIRACRVATGQNRWPIWREEARWVAKWAGGRDQGFFFFNLLTAFLATHTDWLQALSPPAYRRRYFQQKAKAEEDALLPARTIIVSDNKIAARRLVFLLAAFLPASQHLPSIRAHRPSTPASLGTLSQSPPSVVVPILKEESLRRKMNRRTGARMPSHSRNLSLQSYSARTSAGAVPPPLAHLSMEGRHERRASDATSIRTSQLPIRSSDLATRKSSAATTATVTAETSIPHFTIAQRADLFSQGRPGSSNSVATDDLKRLAKEDSTASPSSAAGERRQSSRWSVISGLWGTRRRDSTTKPPGPSGSDGQKGGPPSPAKAEGPSVGVVPKAAPEAEVPGRSGGEHPGITRGTSATGSRDTTPPPRASTDTLGFSERAGAVQKMQRTPNPSGAFVSPVKTSINVDDGVIDVDVPLPDFITSFESAVSSPSSSGYLSASGFGTALDAFEQASRFFADGDVPLNVAGFLQQYHPDFVLQALPSQEDIVEQVKASMRAEPSPPLLPGAQSSEKDTERWLDISSAIVADTTTFKITCIRYRRLVKPKAGVDPRLAPTTPANTYSSVAPAPLNPSYEVQLKEEFLEEPVVTFDDVLVEAVEKVIATAAAGGGGTIEMLSKVSSTSSSRSTSKRRERSDSMSAPTQNDARAPTHHQHPPPPPPPQGGLAVPQEEVPRSRCKTVLLSALEEIIQDVIRERERDQAREQEQEGYGGGDAAAVAREESPLREAVRAWIESVDLGD
ncbi:hypothetical protein VTK56DRAFT_2748 [Thermocarpiscus australiensis]